MHVKFVAVHFSMFLFTFYLKLIQEISFMLEKCRIFSTDVSTQWKLLCHQSITIHRIQILRNFIKLRGWT